MKEFFMQLHALTFWEQLLVWIFICSIFCLIRWLIFSPITSRLDKIIKLLKERDDLK